MQVRRVEKHVINKQNKFYQILQEKCHIAKNIYNHGNYLIRQEFINNGKLPRLKRRGRMSQIASKINKEEKICK